MSLVLDTGPIVAALNRRDRDHQRCARLLADADEELAVPGPVLVEVDYWLTKLGGPQVWARFVTDVASGAYRVVHPIEADLVRAAELETAYQDLRLGFVDASVIAICERLQEPKVVTLDRRHFSVVKPRHCSALQLQPG